MSLCPAAPVATAGRRRPAPLPLLLLGCSLCWSTGYLMMKLLGSEIGPFALTAVRGVMGAGLIALWLLLLRQSIRPRGREWRDWAVLGFFQGILPNTLTAYAVMQIPAGLTAMIQATSPLIVALLAHLLFADERLSWRRGLGVLLGFGGMAILLGPAAFGGDPGSLWGALAMVVTAASYAVGSLYVRSIPDARPARLALGQQAFAGLPTLAAVLLLAGPGAFAAVPDNALTLAALGLVATALPILLFMQILRRAGPTVGSMTGYLTPIWTLLLGALLLAERVAPAQALGGCVVLLGIALASRRRRR